MGVKKRTGEASGYLCGLLSSFLNLLVEFLDDLDCGVIVIDTIPTLGFMRWI